MGDERTDRRRHGVRPRLALVHPSHTLYLISNFAVPALQGYATATTTPRDVGRLFALLALDSSVGSMVAPSIGGWLGEWADLRVVYGVASGVDTPLPAALGNYQLRASRACQRPRSQSRRKLKFQQPGAIL